MTDLLHPDLVSYPDAMMQGLEALRALEPMTLPDHADKHFFLAPGSSGLPGEWVTAPFQRGIMLVIGSDAVRRVYVQKPARVGYTKMLAAAINYFAERKRRSGCLWQPSDSDVKEFVQDEIDPLFDFVPTLADALVVDPRKLKDSRNTVHRKEFKGATWHFKGGKAAGNYRRMTLDVAFLDEVDGFNAIIKGSEGKDEGSPGALSWIRVTDSAFPKQVMGSTPTIAGASLIEEAVQSAECVIERYVRCPSCEEAQRLEWGGTNSKHGIKWQNGDPKTARYVCIGCGHPMSWGDINLIDSKGFWASDRLRLVEEGDGYFVSRATGERVATPEIIGIKFSTLVSPFYSWSEIVKEFIAADRRLKLGDPSEMYTFTNTRMGETVSLSHMVQRDPETLYKRCERYEHEVPVPVTCITAGIDVQIDRVEIEFRGWGAGEESWGLQYVKLIGDTSQIGELDGEGGFVETAGTTIYHQLLKLLRRKFKHPIYGEMGLTIACIDSGYQTSNIYQFCRLDPFTYIPVKGTGSSEGKQIVDFSGKASELGVYFTLIGSDNAMDVVHQRLGITDDGPGKYHWPKDNVGFGLDYFNQLLAEKRVRKIKSGRPYMTWICPPNARNEPADTAKYNLAAVKLAQQAKGVVLHAPTTELMSPTNSEDIDVAQQIRDIATRMNRPGAQR